MIWRYPNQPCLITRYLRSHVYRRYSSRSLRSLAGGYRTIAQVLEPPQTFHSDPSSVISVTGIVRTVRKQKRISFAALGDGSTIQTLQVVLEPAQAEGLHTGTAVEVTGEWKPSPAGKEQSYELKAQIVRIVGSVDAESYPLQKKYHTPEYLRTIPHLRLRTPFNALMTRLRSESEHNLHDFFHRQQLVKVQPPIITSSDCEGAGEVFTLSANSTKAPATTDSTLSRATPESFFRTPRYLTVSSQLHLETFLPEHHGVWSLSPTFRAEKSDTPRHLSEFSMLEVEIRTERLDEIMDLAEDLIRHLVGRLQQSKLGHELLKSKESGGSGGNREGIVTAETTRHRWECLVGQPWPRITYSEALERLQTAASNGQAVFKSEPSGNSGLQLEHEKYIVEQFGKGGPVFVTDYPKGTKPFYMFPSEDTAECASVGIGTVACFDLLMPEVCEVVGGSLREHRLPQLVRAMRHHGLSMPRQTPDDVDEASHSQDSPSSKESFGGLDWYVDLRRHGSVPHGGFGLGFDRLLGYLGGVSSIRDVVPFPRYYGFNHVASQQLGSLALSVVAAHLRICTLMTFYPATVSYVLSESGAAVGTTAHEFRLPIDGDAKRSQDKSEHQVKGLHQMIQLFRTRLSRTLYGIS